MDAIYINGGRELNGALDIVTAKNALLPILAGAIISGKRVVIRKVAMFLDVKYMLKILEDLGAIVNIEKDFVYIDSGTADKYIVSDEFTKKVRSSVFML